VDTLRVDGLEEVELGRFTVESFVFQALPSLWSFVGGMVELIAWSANFLKI
jgi:hypothetical protein